MLIAPSKKYISKKKLMQLQVKKKKKILLVSLVATDIFPSKFLWL